MELLTSWVESVNPSNVRVLLYLLIKVLWSEKEVVERHKVSLQQPHQQHQVDPVCKLEHRHISLT